jgi:hypothetical protein
MLKNPLLKLWSFDILYETLNRIITYNVMFNLINNYRICSLYCMKNSVQMATLNFNMNCSCNKLFFYCALNLINTQKSPKHTLNEINL